MPTMHVHAAREFKVIVADMEEELAEVAQQVQVLQRFSVDSLSFEVSRCSSMTPAPAVPCAKSCPSQAL